MFLKTLTNLIIGALKKEEVILQVVTLPWEEGQEIMTNTVSVIPSPVKIPVAGGGVKEIVVNKAATSAVKKVVKEIINK